MTVVSLFACVAILWGLLARRSGSVLFSRIERLAPSAKAAWICALAIVPLYAAQLLALVAQSRFENMSPEFAWMKALPVPVFDDRADSAPLHALFDALYLGLALCESLALATIVLALRRDAGTSMNKIVIGAAFALASLSLFAPVMSTTDPYEYIAAGMVGFTAYAPSNGGFLGSAYGPYVRHIPLSREIYGPLWVAIEIVLSRLGSSIYQKIEAIRLSNLVFVAAFILFLARARAPRPALVAFALNPALWYYSVANPHSDIEGLALIAGVYACARRSKSTLAAAFLLAAGLVKLPFVIIGGALLVPIPGATRRCLVWIAAIALALATSYLVSGPAYLANLSRFAAHGATANWSPDWLAIAPLLAVATALLVVFRRGLIGVAWLFGQMAPLAAAWYLLWGIAYALASGSEELYFVMLPLAATQQERLGGISAAVLIAATLCVVIDYFAGRRHRSSPIPQS